MKDWIWVLAAALNGVVAIAAATLGRHLLGDDAGRAALLATGAQYALYHALALIGLAALARAHRGDAIMGVVAALFIAGTVLFSGSLYLLAISGIRLFAWITPFGGIAFIAGWAVLALFAWRQRRASAPD
jgi:uncharacterized membrane protein YgdD (TMEM256/DUF423 family)